MIAQRTPVTFKTEATVTLTVSQMLAISIALDEAATWNREQDCPQSAAELEQLRVTLREQFSPYFKALEDRVLGYGPFPEA